MTHPPLPLVEWSPPAGPAHSFEVGHGERGPGWQSLPVDQRRAGVVLAPPSFFHPGHANTGVQVDGLPPAVLARGCGNGGGSGLGLISEAPPAPDACR